MAEDKRQPITLPHVEELRSIRYPSKEGIQPDWIKERFPEYVRDHGMAHEMSSVRRAFHAGREIEIRTTYEIKIDGRPVNIHAIVNDDGQLVCHSTPYVRYASALDVVRALLDRFPESFPRNGGHDHGHAHGGHGEHHEGGER